MYQLGEMLLRVRAEREQPGQRGRIFAIRAWWPCNWLVSTAPGPASRSTAAP